MPRYFYSELASRPLVDGTIRIEFEGVGIFGGRLCGVFASDDPAQLTLLTRAVAQQTGITEISFEDYMLLEAQKKTPHNSTPSPDSPPPQASRGPTLADKAGVESAAVPVPVESSSEKLLTPIECIVIGPVNSPDAFVEERDRVAAVTKLKRKRAA